MSPVNRNVRTRDFKALYDRLPERVRRLAVSAFKTFRENPMHPALRLHALDDNDKGQHREGSFAVYVNMQYRAIYVPDGGTNVWYWIGSHNDYENFTGKK